MQRPLLVILLLMKAISFCFAQNQKQKSIDLQLLSECKRSRPNPTRIDLLIEAGADPNITEPKGGTALMWLALNGDYDSFVMLIENGANPLLNGQIEIDEFQLGSLVTAAIYGAHYHYHDYRILKWLAANSEIPLNRPDYFPHSKQEALTPLHAAAAYGEIEAMQILLAQRNRKKIDINARCSACNGKTPLMLAAERSDKPEFALLLLKNSADVTLRDNDQLTAFDYARQFGGRKVFEALSAYKQTVPAVRYLPTSVSESFEQAAHHAILSGDSSRAKALYSKAWMQTSYDFEIDLLDGFEFVRLSEGMFQHLDTSFTSQVSSIALFQQKMLSAAGHDNAGTLRQVLNFPDSVRIDKSFDRIFPLYAKLAKFFPQYTRVKIEAPVYPKPNLSRIFASQTLKTLRPINHPLADIFSGDLLSLEQAAYSNRLHQPGTYVDQLLKIARQSVVSRDTATAEKYWQKALDFTKHEWQSTAAQSFVAAQVVRGYIQIGNPVAAGSIPLEYPALERESFDGRIARSMLGKNLKERRDAMTEILDESKKYSVWQATEALLLMAESFEDELNYEKAAGYYQMAVKTTERQLVDDPLFMLLCYKTAWCHFKSGNYDYFKIWQDKAHSLRIQTPIWSPTDETLEAIASEYREQSYQLAYRSMATFTGHYNRQQSGSISRSASSLDFNEINQALANARSECSWLIVEARHKEALDVINPVLNKWNSTTAKPSTWLKLQLMKAQALRGSGKGSDAGELLSWLENETVRHLGIFSDLMSDVYFEPLELFRQQGDKSAILIKLKQIETYQRNRQQQIPTFLLDPTEYDLYLQFNQKYINQYTAVAIEMSAGEPSLLGSLFNQAMLNKGLQLLGDRILRTQIYTTLEGFVSRLNEQNKAEIKANSKNSTPEEKAKWKKVFEELQQKTTDEVAGNYEMKKIFAQLDQLFKTLAQAYYQGLTGYETILTEADLRYRPLEQQAIRRMEKYLNPYFSRRWQNLQDSLKADKALVDFIVVPMQDSIRYYALVLRQGRTEPSLVPICTEDRIRKLLDKAQGTQKGIDALYGSSDLREIIWDNLRPALSGVSYVHYVPVGLLHRLSFDAFTPSNYVLTRLLTSQEVVEKGSWMSSKGRRKISLWGGIEYGRQRSSKKVVSTRSEAVREVPSRSRDSRGEQWKFLPGTAAEVQSIHQIVKEAREKRLTSYTGFKANEEAFKSGKHLGGQFETPDVVHLATHGFFYPLKPRRSAGVASKSNSPLARAGLALARANFAATGQTVSHGEDGLLTALEVADLNFVGSRLVVLSACETALGDINTEEGVYGLQRAFKMAGVRYILMSLWKVPDTETAQMMKYFYENLMASANFDVETAFQNAQQQMMKDHPSPYYWAGFVLTR